MKLCHRDLDARYRGWKIAVNGRFGSDTRNPWSLRTTFESIQVGIFPTPYGESMSDNPGYGFVPSPSSPKKELEAPKANPAVVNNYFTVAIDPQSVLLVVLLVVLMMAIIRLSPTGLRA